MNLEQEMAQPSSYIEHNLGMQLKVKQNHLHFHKECMYLELTHTILLGRDASEESVTSWGKQQI